MKRFVTLLALGLGLTLAADAQPARTSGTTQDLLWARDVGSAALTLDGALTEPEWASAQTFEIKWEGTALVPGGGWETFGTYPIAGPTDPVDATLYLLRKGNVLWVGVEARDKSVGGSTDFFQHDGLIMSVVDKRNRDTILPDATTPYRPHNFNGSMTDEIFFSWLNRQPGTTPPFEPDSVGMGPLLFGNFVSDQGVEPNTIAGAAVVNGTSNDDFNGNATRTDDVGYTMEVTINLETLGFDMTDADGDWLPITFGIYDLDYAWPSNPDLQYRTRAWFQNPWGGDMPLGTAYVAGNPSVTVASGATPAVTEPDLRIPMASSEGTVTLDGQLSETIWSNIDPQVTLQYQMSTEMMDALPGIGPFYTHWFRPGASESVEVVDPSVGQFRMFHEGTKLYVGFDSDDNAISGQVNNAGRADGIRIMLRDLSDEDHTLGANYPGRQYTVFVDSTGAARLLNDAADNMGVQAAAFLKGSSTAGDASDIDSGYQIELVIDLDSLNVDFTGDRLAWLGAVYYDGDDLDPEANSYGMFTWWLTERSNGPAARAYLDPMLIAGTPSEGGPSGADGLRALGNAPNPFAATTAIRYALPRAAEVTVEVYDVLGRRVQTVEAGLQSAGSQATLVDASALSAGAYVYRVRLNDGTSVSGRMLIVR